MRSPCVLAAAALAACLHVSAATTADPRPELQLALGAVGLEDAAGVVQDLRGLGWVIRFRGLDFPIYLFSPETALHETTSLHLAPTPQPTPWGGSPTPRRMLGSRIYGLGPTNGRIGPWGWVAKMGVLQ